jgi:hypothetical protein
MLTAQVARYKGNGVECHDLCHGFVKRPMSRVERLAWSFDAAHWMRQGRLFWADTRGVAEEIGRDPSRPTEDEPLRAEFRRRLEKLALTRPRMPLERQLEGRIRNLAKASLPPKRPKTPPKS